MIIFGSELFKDIKENLKDKSNFWLVLAKVDIRQKYKRTILGRMWLLMLPLIQIIIIGPIYSVIFNKNIDEYIFYLTIGILVWNFISNSLTELSTVLIHSESYLLESKINVSRFVFKVIYKNVYIFINCIPVIVFVMLFYKNNLNINVYYSLFGFLFIIINIYLIGIIISLVSVKYRDIPIIITNMLNLLFLVTPVFWVSKDFIENKFLIMYFNPFFHMLESIRSPLISGKIPSNSLIYLVILAFILYIVSEYIMRKFKYKVVYLL
jgi:ABC-type polysaccharide/polyol phosphate export permease